MNLDKFLPLLTEPEVFCEVGVYFYQDYCRLKKQIEQGYRVILVEPAPNCTEDIEKNLSILTEAGKELHVQLWKCAVGDEHGTTELHFEGASAFINEAIGKSPYHNSEYQRDDIPAHIVKKVTFDAIDNGDIDVLLVDIEGMEYFVLKHMISRPQLIVLETHYKRYKNPYLNQINTWMENNGYWKLDEDESDSVYLKKYDN